MSFNDGTKRLLWKKFLPLLVIAAGLIAYHNSFSGPFIFDDFRNIQENPHVRTLWPLWDAMAGTKSRPLVNLTFALNYALGGLDVWGYHAVNVAVHLLAALTLYGIVRRTLLTEGLRECYGAQAPWMALAVALVWVVHPLNTQAVDYIVQRAESMMGLFYLLALYCVIRGAENWGHNPISILKLGLCPQFSAFRVMSPNLWFLAAIICCALGMYSKAVIVTAPVVVLLYDRIFLSRSWGAALRRRAGLYAGLGILALWMACNPTWTEEGVGFGLERVTASMYARTQPGVILHYLRLAIWPHPLVLDYAWSPAQGLREILPPSLGVGVLVLATAWALRYMPRLGFLGLSFFLILAPTSSFFPMLDFAFEHRMYLPLAAIITFFVFVAWEVLKRVMPNGVARGCLVGLVSACVIAALGWCTLARNEVYASGLSVWSDVLSKRPDNARAHVNLGTALFKLGKWEDAAAHYDAAVRLAPHEPEAQNAMGFALAAQGKFQEALDRYTEALRLDPRYAPPHHNMGVVFAQQGKFEEAVAHFEEALRLKPGYRDASVNLCSVLAKQGKYDEAVAQFTKILEIEPDNALAHYNLGVTLEKLGRQEEAAKHFEAAEKN